MVDILMAPVRPVPIVARITNQTAGNAGANTAGDHIAVVDLALEQHPLSPAACPSSAKLEASRSVPRWPIPRGFSGQLGDASHTSGAAPGDGATRSLTPGLRALLVQFSENRAPELPRR
jgi:hypothetical protein